MLNVNELENRWRKYKIKSFIPYGVIIISLGVIVVLISTIYASKETTEDIVEIREIKQAKIIKEEQDIAKVFQIAESQKNIIKNSTSSNKKLTLSPSLNFMSNMKHDAIVYYESEKTPILKKTKIVQKSKVIVEKPKVKKIKEPVAQKNIIRIERQSTQEDISHVLKRFKKNNNPALSLFIAKKYYELGEYNKSYNYALITNDINDNIDASWIIFAKSLVKLNQKDKAINTLKKYIEHSHSSKAKILLEEISTGKFR